MDIKCAGQVRIWSWFNDFWQSYAPLTLKKNKKFSVSIWYLFERLKSVLNLNMGRSYSIVVQRLLLYRWPFCTGYTVYLNVIMPSTKMISLGLKYTTCNLFRAAYHANLQRLFTVGSSIFVSKLF
jgi:hypothetical protein